MRHRIKETVTAGINFFQVEKEVDGIGWVGCSPSYESREEAESKIPSAAITIDGNEVIDQFFVKWEAEWMQWFTEMQTMYRTNYEEFKKKMARREISKQNAEMIRGRLLYPRQGCGASIQEIISKDMENKKATLLYKIKGKVGEVTEVELHCGKDGTPNGYVKGTNGTVRINTIIAGGEVQCIHYRVLVK